MMVEGTHYNPDCSCKSCKITTSNTMSTKKTPQEQNWTKEFHSLCLDWEVGNIDDATSFKAWKQEVIDFIYAEKEKSYEQGFARGFAKCEKLNKLTN